MPVLELIFKYEPIIQDKIYFRLLSVSEPIKEKTKTIISPKLQANLAALLLLRLIIKSNNQ